MTSDVDECELETANCDENAACYNTVGSFKCACITGYTGNGVTCDGTYPHYCKLFITINISR